MSFNFNEMSTSPTPVIAIHEDAIVLTLVILMLNHCYTVQTQESFWMINKALNLVPT